MLIRTQSKTKPPVTAKPNRAHPLTRGLAGCWLLNEGAGRIVHDASGHHHNGSFSGGPLWSPGQSDYAVEFDGHDDWISMGDCLDLGRDDVTLLAIINYSAATQPEETGGVHYAAIAGKGYLGPNEKGYGLFIRDNYVAWQTRNSVTNFYIVSDNALNDGQYHTAVGVCDRDNPIGVMLYIDGIRQAMAADPTTLNGLDLSGPQAFAVGSRQDQAGIWLFDFQGSVAVVYVWKRALTETEIRQLQCDPFGLFAYRQAEVFLTASAGVLVEFSGSITGESTISAVAGVTRNLIGPAAAGISTSAMLEAVRNLSGKTNGCAALRSTLFPSTPRVAFGAMLENESFWLREALLNGMTSSAYKLGIVLTEGWFWTRRQGCAVVYRGASITETDFSNILYVTDVGTEGFSLAGWLSHIPGRTYCYVIRRFNSCGYQERTTNAAVTIRITPESRLEVPSPNIVNALGGEQVAGRLELVWFYCALDQKAVPQQFNVYWDHGTDLIDYDDPVAVIPYRARRFYHHNSGTLVAGQYRFALRAESVAHVESGTSAEVICQVNHLLPEAPVVLVTEAI